MGLIYCGLLILLFILMVLLLDYLQKSEIAKGETTRKLGHLILGGILIVMPFLFDNILYPFIVCIVISLIIYISSKKNKLACADNVDRKTYGTFLFPIGILITYIIAKELHRLDLFFPSIIILIISDLVAAFAGRIPLNSKNQIIYKLNNLCYNKFHKTINGSVSFLICTLVILLCFGFHDEYVLLNAILITLVEFFSTKGTDNLTIPVGAYILLYLQY